MQRLGETLSLILLVALVGYLVLGRVPRREGYASACVGVMMGALGSGVLGLTVGSVVAAGESQEIAGLALSSGGFVLGSLLGSAPGCWIGLSYGGHARAVRTVAVLAPLLGAMTVVLFALGSSGFLGGYVAIVAFLLTPIMAAALSVLARRFALVGTRGGERRG